MVFEVVHDQGMKTIMGLEQLNALDVISRTGSGLQRCGEQTGMLALDTGRITEIPVHATWEC